MISFIFTFQLSCIIKERKSETEKRGTTNQKIQYRPRSVLYHSFYFLSGTFLQGSDFYVFLVPPRSLGRREHSYEALALLIDMPPFVPYLLFRLYSSTFYTRPFMREKKGNGMKFWIWAKGTWCNVIHMISV